MDTQEPVSLDAVPHRVEDPERIPTPRYYDETFFRLEKERLWPHVWQMACRLEEIPEVGDFVEYSILDRSVIVVRTAEGVRAFRNACRHRGVRLTNGPGNCSQKGFVCPFHGWRWNMEGECTFVFGRDIFSDEALRQAEIALVPVRVECWAGCAFINLDNEAPSLRECLGPVAARMEARNVDRLRMDWWCATILPTNWKLAMEAFQEGYHVMQTHPQFHAVMPMAGAAYGPDGDGWAPNMDLDARQMVNAGIDQMITLNRGMAGMVDTAEVAVAETLRDMDVPDDPILALRTFYGRAYADVLKDAQARCAPYFDLAQVAQEQEFHAVEFMFPHFFLLPFMGGMSSYRIRPLTAETCLFEIWSLVLRPDEEPFETPTEPTMLPYDSPDLPEIPRQDYANLPLQQLGLHNLEELRLSCRTEGMISNYQRLIDGYLARRDPYQLAAASCIVNSGFDAPILDIGF